MLPEGIKKGVIYKLDIGDASHEYIMIFKSDIMYVKYIKTYSWGDRRNSTALRTSSIKDLNIKILKEVDALPEGVKFDLDDHQKKNIIRLIF